MHTHDLTLPAAEATAHADAEARSRQRRVLLAFLVIALVVAALFLLQGDATRPTHANPVDLPIATWIWHFNPQLAHETAPFYRDLLKAIPSDAKILVFVPQDQDARLFQDTVGPAADDSRLTFRAVRGPIGGWARDFYTTYEREGRTHLYPFPAGQLIPQERATQRVPEILAKRQPSLTREGGTDALVGGDLLLTGNRILVGEGTVARLAGQDPAARQDLRTRIEAAFDRKLLIVGEGLDVPYFHIDMFLTVLDDRRLLLGDPALALEQVGEGWRQDAPLEVPHLGTFEKRRQQRLRVTYEAIRKQLVDAGFEVHRIPIVHGERKAGGSQPPNLLTWNNAVLETRGDRRIAYIPRIGFKPLDEEAKRIYADLGFEVHTVDCGLTLTHGGAVHCLTNELRGTSADSSARP